MPVIERAETRLVLATLLAAALIVGGGALVLQQRQEQAMIAKVLTGGDPERAPELITRYGCGGCHTISGVPGADGQVAPPLSGLLQRIYIGGSVQNTPDNLIAWIVDPQQFSPHAAMPPTGIDTRQARDVATYLYAH
jgi:cytochrome c2